MDHWMDRVCEEQEELDAKIKRLENFLRRKDGSPLSVETQVLLFSQLEHMRAYSAILHMRIDRFDD